MYIELPQTVQNAPRVPIRVVEGAFLKRGEEDLQCLHKEIFRSSYTSVYS